MDIQAGIEEIRYNTTAMRSILTDMTTTIQYQKLGDLLEEKRQKNLSVANRVYATMKKIEQDLPEQGDYSTLARIKMCQYLFHREDFMLAWAEHESFLVCYEERMKKLLVRQAKISEWNDYDLIVLITKLNAPVPPHTVDANIDEEELEALIENQTTSLFVGNVRKKLLQNWFRIQSNDFPETVTILPFKDPAKDRGGTHEATGYNDPTQ